MSQEKRELIIRKTFEPNRLSESHVADAYDLLVPQIKQAINITKNAADELTSILNNERRGENKS